MISHTYGTPATLTWVFLNLKILQYRMGTRNRKAHKVRLTKTRAGAQIGVCSSIPLIGRGREKSSTLYLKKLNQLGTPEQNQSVKVRKFEKFLWNGTLHSSSRDSFPQAQHTKISLLRPYIANRSELNSSQGQTLLHKVCRGRQRRNGWMSRPLRPHQTHGKQLPDRQGDISGWRWRQGQGCSRW